MALARRSSSRQSPGRAMKRPPISLRSQSAWTHRRNHATLHAQVPDGGQRRDARAARRSASGMGASDCALSAKYPIGLSATVKRANVFDEGRGTSHRRRYNRAAVAMVGTAREFVAHEKAVGLLSKHKLQLEALA